MKKITTAETLGGAPFNKGDFRTVFNDEIWDAMEALLSPFSSDTEGLIVSGCVISGAGPYDISEGIVFLNGEFMRLPSATGQTLPKYIVPAPPVDDNRKFAIGTTHTLFITKAAELVGSAPGSGQYIAITSATDPGDRRWNPVISQPLIKSKKLDIVNWNVQSSPSTNVLHGLDYDKIIGMTGIIRADPEATNRYPIGSLANSSPDSPTFYFAGYGVSQITVRLSSSANLNLDNYNQTGGYVRGHIVVFYVP